MCRYYTHTHTHVTYTYIHIHIPIYYVYTNYILKVRRPVPLRFFFWNDECKNYMWTKTHACLNTCGPKNEVCQKSWGTITMCTYISIVISQPQCEWDHRTVTTARATPFIQSETLKSEATIVADRLCILGFPAKREGGGRQKRGKLHRYKGTPAER